MALTKVGGFGLYQFVTTLAMSVLRNSGMVHWYLFAFYVLPQ